MKREQIIKILEKNISIRGLLDFGNYSCVGIPYEDALKAMQAYHEAKMKEVMDEDIERESHELYVDGCKPEFKEYADSILSFVKSGYVAGAKAMRNGEIKHVSRDNE